LIFYFVIYDSDTFGNTISSSMPFQTSYRLWAIARTIEFEFNWNRSESKRFLKIQTSVFLLLNVRVQSAMLRYMRYMRYMHVHMDDIGLARIIGHNKGSRSSV